MSMIKNVGSVDKTVRLVAGVALLAWAFIGPGLAATVGLVAAIVGAVLLVTGLVNFCPAFKLLGISSLKS